MRYCGRKADEVTVQQYATAEELPPQWEALVPGGHFLQRRHLQVTEQAALPDISFIYTLVCVKDTPVFAAGFQLLQLNGRHVNKAMVPALQYTVWQLFSTVRRPKLLVGGHLFRHDVTSVCYAQGAQLFEVYTWYKLCIDAAMRSACASAVLVKDMPEALAKYFTNYSPEYMQLRNDISMEMPIPHEWQHIGDYEKALKHKYAQRFRKIRQQWQNLEIRELTTQEVAHNKHRLHNLYMQVTEHQQVRIGLLNAEFLAVLKREYPQLKVWGIYDGSGLIGFFSAWVYPGLFDMFYIGFDYEKNKEYNLYFNILFFAVEQAIANKAHKLVLGRTALDAKARLGCTPHYLSTFLYIKSALVRGRIMQAQQKTTEHEGEWESRHPLKNQQ